MKKGLRVAHMQETLNYVENANKPLKTTDISKGMNLNYGSVYKALRALEHNGDIKRGKDKRWKLNECEGMSQKKGYTCG